MNLKLNYLATFKSDAKNTLPIGQVGESFTPLSLEVSSFEQ